jgi:hypothetical protein
MIGLTPTRALRGAGTVVACTLVLASVPASLKASLGGEISTVETDRMVMSGVRRTLAGAGYTVHEIQAPTGTVVREFVSSSGTVFAVAWQGPFIPNLRLLLGPHFDAFSTAASSRPKRPGHGPLLVATPGLVVESGGKMRAFFGRAYLPDLLPPGLAEGSIE